jgi:hypothetical protein
MMGSVNKSDKLDAKGINRLQRTGTLPTVWIPGASVRDARELPRTRMVLGRQQTQLKNSVHATLGKYGFTVEGASNAFGKKGARSWRNFCLSSRPIPSRHFDASSISSITWRMIYVCLPRFQDSCRVNFDRPRYHRPEILRRAPTTALGVPCRNQDPVIIDQSQLPKLLRHLRRYTSNIGAFNVAALPSCSLIKRVHEQSIAPRRV